MGIELSWLPNLPDWRNRLKALTSGAGGWAEAVALAKFRLDFIQTNTLDSALRRIVTNAPPHELSTKPVRLALLGSSTLAHLHAGIRVAGARRGICISTYENQYGQYLQELCDTSSALHIFKPTAVLFAFDAFHLTAGLHAGMTRLEADALLQGVKERIRELWQLARGAFASVVIQQMPLQICPQLLGNNEHRLPGSRSAMVARLGAELRQLADEDGVQILAVDSRASQDGLSLWHEPALWRGAKQEICPLAGPFYGDLVARLLASALGCSHKCLIVDLDNTLWGGVVGDDSMEGLTLGQGSALGEAYIAFQEYLKELSRRGIVLAVCSKNDTKIALEAFEQHPEMILKCSDIACFAINWNDKPANIRAIAEKLNIGLDALVFVDDNAMERDLVRRQLPMVSVPEMPDDPSLYPRTLADAGYFEALTVTAEDRDRTQQYRENSAREQLKTSATDLPSYLRSLEMRLLWRRFDSVGVARITQLINKTNQFNLTTRRYSEQEVLGMLEDQSVMGLQFRLIDRFGDNGVVAVVVGRILPRKPMKIDSWLMSCRVIGREVEIATMNLLAQEARRAGASSIVGQYVPSARNEMTRSHYEKLGFRLLETSADGSVLWTLDLSEFTPLHTSIQLEPG